MRLEQFAFIAEVTGSVAIIATLVILILEVQENTAVIERQAHMERFDRIASPYLEAGDIREVYAKVKEVDGMEPLTQRLMDRYKLNTEEAVQWARSMHSIWAGIEADYVYLGPSPDLERFIGMLLSYPDVQLFWEEETRLYSDEFRSYVNGIDGQISSGE
jgi:hypothetical protein